MSSFARLLQQHPDWPQADLILHRLHEAGHRALLAGGCVRDALLGCQAGDLDIATSALPDQVIALFEKTVEVGKSFGVVRVLLKGSDLEVATFREDGDYLDGRRPESVRFLGEKEDALRRDFTVNALFYDTFTDQILDYVEGEKDLRAGLLRTVGPPSRRFDEDRLRLLRALRFSVQLNFQLEPSTWQEIKTRAAQAATVSRERIRDEMFKMLKVPAGDRAPRLLRKSGLLVALFPELQPVAEAMEKSAGLFLQKPSTTLAEALTRWLAGAVKSGASVDVWTRTLANLRLAKTEEKSVLRQLNLIADPEKNLWGKSLGARILLYDENDVRQALDLLEEIGEKDSRRKDLHRAWTSVCVNGVLPMPLLKGDAVKARLGGARIGEALRAALEAQMEGAFRTEAEALTWFERWLKMNSAFSAE